MGRGGLLTDRRRESDMKLSFAILVAAFGKELTPADWDTETAGKTVFIKFLAPW